MQPNPNVFQSDNRFFPVWSMAWRKLDFCRVGTFSRRISDGRLESLLHILIELTDNRVFIPHQETLLTSSAVPASDFPRHVAIIMDGNGRWARRRLLPRLEGHRQGAKSVRRAVEFCRSNGIEFLTLYAFSTENWQRPEGEVSGLMKLLSQFLDSELEELHSNGIRFRVIGQLNRLSAPLAAKIVGGIERTKDNRAMTLNVALSYGGRQEIVAAAQKIASAAKSGQLDEGSISEQLFSDCLDTAGTPDPDLLIRKGGESRITNFLLGQLD
jgi:undecaprenyl diphosphate synthase